MGATDTVILFPSPSFPHLVSMVEFAKLVFLLHSELSIIILVPPMPFDSEYPSSYINGMTQTKSSISFVSIPDTLDDKTETDRIALSSQIMNLGIPYVMEVLKTISSTSSVLALVTSAIHVDLDNIPVPVYYYFTSCASALALLLNLPKLHSQTTKSFKDLKNTVFEIPGLPRLPASHFPQPVLDRDDPAYSIFLNISNNLSKSEGVILNTFHSLESRAIKAIADGGVHVVSGHSSQNIYCVGPLISVDKDNSGPSYDVPSTCLTWLDNQPNASVVFLCFGSRGIFSEAQLKEIAGGLERSNQRFLWVVKNPDNIQDEPELDELLPQGFLERTKEKGLVLKSWAPQNAILSHKSLGGFVTHCGWNSIIEAICNGVPMVAWPLYAEQKMNSVVLVEEMKLAIPISTTPSSDDEAEPEGLVRSEEVEKKVRQLMESVVGKNLRQTCLEMQALANSAWSNNGGSSFSAFSQLIQTWKHK